jgi:hypothetical protein
MPTIPLFLRRVLCVLLGTVALTTAALAQELPSQKISANDIRRALIWTGHYSMLAKGDALAAYNQAVQAWQAAKHYPLTEGLSSEQASELMSEAEARREAFGWSMLEDRAVGFSVGVPTRVVKFTGARSSNGALRYSFEGNVGYSIGVYYGGANCFNWARKVNVGQVTFREERWNGFSIAGTDEGRRKYLRGLCLPSGSLLVSLDISEIRAPQQEVLFSAMAESLTVERNFDSTALPRPRLEAVAPLVGDFFPVSASRTADRGKPAADIDKSGKTDTIRRETRGSSELTPEQAFEKISPAVFMVDAGDRLGSAVAIGEHELLTNCHVVKEVARVTLRRDKAAETAEVVSINQKADRCILRTAATLAKWVAVRPYDDIKVGERALTIGTPQGLELTIAEGIVSSKRSYEGARLVQTTAAVSQGSSGGGLFDGQGHLLGITTFYLQGGQNLNFAVSGEDFAK